MSKTEEETMSLTITTVPNRHYKNLIPREVNYIQTLKTFVVPAKFDICERKMYNSKGYHVGFRSNQIPLRVKLWKDHRIKFLLLLKLGIKVCRMITERYVHLILYKR
jgi:hypothetical protein